MPRFSFDAPAILAATAGARSAVSPPRTEGGAREASAHEAVTPGSLEKPSHGPGWFDSSWDLSCGLDVREGLPSNASLSEWFAVCFAEPMPSPEAIEWR